MKVIDTHLLETGPTPPDIARQRQEILDFHLKLGQPVIFKHRWNLNDQQNGLTEECIYHDASYERSKTNCPYCFGTGFLGGFDDGVVIFSTIADAPVDQLKIGPQGYILFDKHPQLTAPWTPLMGDGDLIILAEFDRATWEVQSTLDRFELNDVTPVTIRGFFGAFNDFKLYKVQQTAEIDRLPYGHVYYDVPVEFDYNAVPVSVPNVGFDVDQFSYNSFLETSFKLIGMGASFSSSYPTILEITGSGTAQQKTTPFVVDASTSGSYVNFEDTTTVSSLTTTFEVEA